MDGECAFCGRGESASRRMYCVDCQADHRVCGPCADDAIKDLAVLGLELYRQVA